MEHISLSNASFGSNNNVFVSDDGAETVLVDKGNGTEETRRQLAAALDVLGFAFADVDRSFLTHWHGDHSSLAGHIQTDNDADMSLIEGGTEAWNDLRASVLRTEDVPGVLLQRVRDTRGEATNAPRLVERTQNEEQVPARAPVRGREHVLFQRP